MLKKQTNKKTYHISQQKVGVSLVTPQTYRYDVLIETARLLRFSVVLL